MIFALWDRSLLASDRAVSDNDGWGGITLAHNVDSPSAVDAVLAEAKAAGATIGREGAPTFGEGIRESLLTSTATPGRWHTISRVDHW